MADIKAMAARSNEENAARQFVLMAIADGYIAANNCGDNRARILADNMRYSSKELADAYDGIEGAMAATKSVEEYKKLGVKKFCAARFSADALARKLQSGKR